MNKNNLPEKRTIMRFFCGILILIAIGIIIHSIPRNSNQSATNNTSDMEKRKEICEEKLINQFQIINPEFKRDDENRINENTIKGNVTFYDGEENYGDVNFLCSISSNGTDAWIEWDVDKDEYKDDVIYDTREEGADSIQPGVLDISENINYN